MSENVEERRGHRGRWLVLVVLLAIGVWVVRSRRAARMDVDTAWPAQERAARHAEAPAASASSPGAARSPVAESDSAGGAPGRAPSTTSTSPRPARQSAPTPAASTPGAARRPSPRPRAAPPAARADLPPGAAPAQPDGSAPGPEYTIKGNAGSMLFHPPTSPYFARTKAEYWFRTAEDARAAGFTEWTPRRR